MLGREKRITVVEPFPVGFETETILGRIRRGDRVVYLNSCACAPLTQQLCSLAGDENVRTTQGIHESIDVENGWATIVIGQCVLDEFLDFSKALSEVARVLRKGGSVLLTGPVSKSGVMKFKSHRGEVDLLDVGELGRRLSSEGMNVVDAVDLTAHAKKELSGLVGNDGTPVLELERSMRYVLVEAKKNNERRKTTSASPSSQQDVKVEKEISNESKGGPQPIDPIGSSCACAGCSLELTVPPGAGGSKGSPNKESLGAASGETREAKPSQFAGRVRFVFLALVAGISLLEILGERLDIQQFGILGSVPAPILVAAIFIGGYPIFKAALTGLWHRTANVDLMMSFGIVAAAAIGQYTSSVLIVFFMTIAHFTESFTVKGSTRAVRELLKLSPKTATVIRGGLEVEVPAEEVVPSDVVIIHPGESVPVDGNVVAGHGVIDQAAITGESIPVEKQPGDMVFAATLNQNGMMKVETERVGEGTTFGKIVKLVIEAQGGAKSRAQKRADRYTKYFLPAALTASLFTFLVSRDVVYAIAVLVAACPCAVGLATPLSVVASTGASAKKGLLIKGGLHLENLAKVDAVVVDKTGTLTMGAPRVTAVKPIGTLSEWEALRIAASIERYSEHPLASAIVKEALDRDI